MSMGWNRTRPASTIRGPLRWGGPPRAIQLDVSRGEALLFPVTARALRHPYSDAGQLPPAAIPCYDLAEMLTEKLRAVSGQRRFAISRDIYDIHQLVGQNIALAAVRQALPAKLAAKGLPPDIVAVASLVQRRPIFEDDWERRLAHLLPPRQPVTFAAAWQAVIELVTALQVPGQRLIREQRRASIVGSRGSERTIFSVAFCGQRTPDHTVHTRVVGVSMNS